MTFQVSFKPDQLSDLVGHLERLRAYYVADASALSRAAMAKEWDGKGRQYAIALIDERMELLHNAEDLWAYLLGI